MTIFEQFEQYEAWVAANPKRFVVDNYNIVCTEEAVGAKVVEVVTAKATTATSVRVEDNKIDLEGFLAWSEQVCNC